MISRLKRFRFHLSTAVVLMLCAACGNWYYVNHYLNPPEDWQVAVQKALERKTSIKFSGAPFFCEIPNLFQDQSVYLFYCKKLRRDETPVIMPQTVGTVEEVLKQVCELKSVRWSVQQGGIFFHGKDEPAPSWKKYPLKMVGVLTPSEVSSLKWDNVLIIQIWMGYSNT